MNRFGVIARFEAKPGKQAEIAAFFEGGRGIVEQEPATTTWTAFQIGPTTYGAFATFASEADRDHLLGVGGPKSSERNAALFTQPPTFEKIDILQARLG